MTQKDTTYQGWKNHATWCVALHINNEDATQKHAQALREAAKLAAANEKNFGSCVWSVGDAARYRLANALKSWIEDEVIDSYPAGSSFADLLRLDLLRGYLCDVNWNEIAQNFLDEGKDSEG